MKLDLKPITYTLIAVATLLSLNTNFVYAGDGSYTIDSYNYPTTDGLSNLDLINDWNHSSNNPFNNSLQLFPTNSYQASTPMYSNSYSLFSGSSNCCTASYSYAPVSRYSYQLSAYPAGYGAVIDSGGYFAPVSRYSYNISQYPGGNSTSADNSLPYVFSPVPGYSYQYSAYPGGTGATTTAAGAPVPGFTARTESYPAGTGAVNNSGSYARVPGFTSNVTGYGINNNSNNSYYYSPVPSYTSNYTSTGFNSNTNNNSSYTSGSNYNGGGFIITGNGINYGGVPGSFVITSSH